MREIVLHVGVHKTGTTSIQSFLDTHRDRLRAQGVEFYRGLYNPSNHMELHGAAMRPERLSPFKIRRKVTGDHAYMANVRRKLAAFADASACDRLLFSAEGLSFLYHPDEMDRLKSILPTGAVRIILYTREPASFLRSYREQTKKTPPPEPVAKDSYGYLEPDSWLLNFDERVDRFRRAFENVTVRRYEDEMEDHGNVIPSFLDEIGVARHFKQSEWSGIFLNRTAA